MSSLTRERPRPALPVARGLAFAVLAANLVIATPQLSAQGLQPGGPVDFGSLPIGTSSLNLTQTFTASATTTISTVITTEEGTTGKDFAITGNTCTGTIFKAQSCNVTITFTPTQPGLRRGALTITSTTGSEVRLFLHGIGLGPQMVFSPVSATAITSLSTVSPSTFKTSAAVYDGAGNLYFNDYLNGRILEQSTSGGISVIANLTQTDHSSMAIDGAGTLYVSAPSLGIVQVIVPGVSSTVLTMNGVTLVSPAGLAVDAIGQLYIADSQANQIVRVASDGATATVLPLTGLTSPISSPYGLAADNTNLYIADYGSGRIVAANLNSGNATAFTANGALANPFGVAVDSAGTLVVANAGLTDLVQVSPTGTVYPLAAAFGYNIASAPLGVLVRSTGDLIASDANLGLVTIPRTTGQLTFPTPTKATFFDSTDGYLPITVQNSGNQPLQFSATDPAITPSVFTDGNTNTCPVDSATGAPLAVAATCTYTVGFTPTAVGSDTGTLTLQATDTVTNAAITGVVNLAGTAITQVDTLVVTATPSITSPGVPVSFTVSAQEGNTVIPTFTGTVTFTMTDATGKFLSGTTYTFTSADAGVHTFPAPAGAQFNTTGVFTISAQFNTIIGTSNTVTVQYPSATTLASSVNPVFINNPTTLTATVSATGATTPATGTITFYDGTTVIGTCTLINGTCGTSVSFTVAGNHPLTAVYPGDINYTTSTSSTLIEVVTDFTASVTMTSSINPSYVNQNTTLTATVSANAGQPGAGVPTGTVTFTEGGATVCTAALVNGVAACSALFNPARIHPLIAKYGGSTTFGPASSATYSQVVIGYTTTATLTSSINPSFINQQTVLTATVAGVASQSPPGTPTGTVIFYDGTTRIGNGTLTNGVATLTISFATAGNHSLTVVYSGDDLYAGITSPIYIQVVTLYSAQATFTSSINPSFVNQQTVLTATISAVAGQTGSGTPTGTVTFKNGTTTLSTVTLVNGVATYTGSFATPGSYPLTAVYSGDANFSAFTSAVLTQVVTLYADQVSLSSSINPSTLNQQTVLTATVTAATGQTGSGTPTGTITFKDGTTTIGTGTLVNGVATLTIAFSTVGNHPLTAVYSGDTNFNPLTSPILTQVVGIYASQAMLTSSINPSVVNQTTTLTATISPTAGETGAPTPTGTVIFKNGATNLGTVTLVNGVATFPASFAAPGSYPLMVVYSGDTNFNPSTSAVLTQIVTGITPIVTLTSSINPSFVNQQTTLTASVSATGVSTLATGTVTFKNGTTTLGTATLVAGVATLPASFAASGTYPLTAVYSGDSNFVAGTSATYSQVVNEYATQAAITSSVNPSQVSQQTTLTITVSAVAGQTGSGTPTGAVTIKDGTTTIGAGTLTNGVFTLSVSFATPGNHPLTVIYAGDGVIYNGVTSPIYIQVVSGYGAQAALTSSINPSFVNQPTTFTATIAASPGQTGAGTPTGTVTFKNGATTLGTATLVNGVATLPSSFATPGSYPITAVYSGDTNFGAVISAILTQVVNDYAVTTSFTSSVNPSSVNQTTALNETITTTPGQTGAVPPTGTVTFKDGTTALGTATVVNGVAILPTSFAVVGNHPLTAVYSGDANYAAFTSPILIQVVENFSAQVALTSSINPSLVNQQTTFTATVSATTSGSGTPTGTVIFKNGTTTLGTVTLVNGVATLPASFAAAGSYPITATYSGDTNFVGASSGVLTQIVNDFTAQATLTSSVNPSLINQQTTFTATISASAGQTGSVTPTGTVTFKNGSATLSTVALVNGVATYATSFPTAGSYSITCTYSGDANYSPTNCSALTQVVNDYTATAVLTSSVNPTFINQQTTLTATIAAASGQAGAGTPTGTVTFLDGTTTLGTAVVANGVATLPAIFTVPGNHALTCSYSGDTNFSPTTCSILTQVVNAYTVSVSLTAASNPVFITIQNTLTATVTPTAGQGAAVPATGSITFMNGSTPIGTVPLSAGTATLPLAIAFVGNYSLTAIYSGDANFLTASSPAYNLAVDDFSIAVATGSSGSATVLGGGTTNYNLTLAPIAGTALAGPITFTLTGAPTGTVVIFSPASVATGAGSTPILLTVKPPVLPQAHNDPGNINPFRATRTAPIALALLALPFIMRRRRRFASLFLWMAFCISAIGLSGCATDASTGYYGTNPQTFNLTVTATSGTLSHTTNLTLTVQ